MNLLFLGTGKLSLCLMAEGFASLHADKYTGVYNAGTQVQAAHPMAIKAMAEAGIDISGKSSGIASVQDNKYDVVITLCQKELEYCPVFSGNPIKVDWNLSESLISQNGPVRSLKSFRKARDLIEKLVNDLFEHGYAEALSHTKAQADLILNNISEGVLAHSLQRKIFYFNRAAEEITGYSSADVLGKDCHEVFPGGLCLSKCLFCDDVVCKLPDTIKHSLTIIRGSGEKRELDMAIKSMHDVQGQNVGVIASFHDRTRELELERRLAEVEQFSGIIGRDPKMQEIYELIRDVADSTVSVLIQGESGTGKELVAAAVHREGTRGNKLFVPINCGALPENLLESELFGHVRGAFTGAIRDKKGRFELADRGTIFLDEIGDITPAMQVKLLRVLQEGTFERVGSEKTVQVDVRVISATNKDLRQEVAEGRFREDLFYRLNVMPIFLPPLRERRNDIPILAKYLLTRALEENARRDQSDKLRNVVLSQDVIDTMLNYNWPGNIRELQNWLQFALVRCKGEEILPEHLPHHDFVASNISNVLRATSSRIKTSSGKRGRKKKLSHADVHNALIKTGGNKLSAAKELGVGRATLYRFLDAQSD